MRISETNRLLVDLNCCKRKKVVDMDPPTCTQPITSVQFRSPILKTMRSSGCQMTRGLSEAEPWPRSKPNHGELWDGLPTLGGDFGGVARFMEDCHSRDVSSPAQLASFSRSHRAVPALANQLRPGFRFAAKHSLVAAASGSIFPSLLTLMKLALD